MYRATIPPLDVVADPDARARSVHVRAAGATRDATRLDDALLKQARAEQLWRKAERLGGAVTADEYVSAKKRTFALMMEHVAHEYGYELRRRVDESCAVVGSASLPPSPVLVDAADAFAEPDAVAEHALDAAAGDRKLPATGDDDDADAEPVVATATPGAVSDTPDDSEQAAGDQSTPPDSGDEDAASDEQIDDAPEEQTDDAAQSPTAADSSDTAESEGE